MKSGSESQFKAKTGRFSEERRTGFHGREEPVKELEPLLPGPTRFVGLPHLRGDCQVYGQPQELRWRDVGS